MSCLWEERGLSTNPGWRLTGWTAAQLKTYWGILSSSKLKMSQQHALAVEKAIMY